MIRVTSVICFYSFYITEDCAMLLWKHLPPPFHWCTSSMPITSSVQSSYHLHQDTIFISKIHYENVTFLLLQRRFVRVFKFEISPTTAMKAILFNFPTDWRSLQSDTRTQNLWLKLRMFSRLPYLGDILADTNSINFRQAFGNNIRSVLLNSFMK